MTTVKQLKFDHSKSHLGYAVDVLISERQQDVFYLHLRIYCPALQKPATLTYPVRVDGCSTLALENRGSDNAQGIVGRQHATELGKFVHQYAADAMRAVFESFMQQESH